MATDFWNTNQASKPGPGAAAPNPTQQSSFQNYLSQGIAYNAPTFGQYQLGANQNLRNIGYGNAGYGIDQSGANLDYTSNLRDLQLQMGQNGIDLGAAQRQPDLIAQLLGLDNQDFGIQRQDAQLAAKGNQEDLMADATARGAVTTTGRQVKQGNIYANLMNQLGHIGVSQDKNTLNAAEQKKQAQDRIDTLQLTAGRLGMKPDELKGQLDNTLAKLGLNHAMSTEDLLDGLASGDLQSKQLLMQIISQAGQYATATGK